MPVGDRRHRDGRAAGLPKGDWGGDQACGIEGIHTSFVSGNIDAELTGVEYVGTCSLCTSLSRREDVLQLTHRPTWPVETQVTTEQIHSLEAQLEVEQNARRAMETEIAQLRSILQKSMES